MTQTVEVKPNGQEYAQAEWNFSENELHAIRELYAPKATDAQFTVFLMEAKRRRLMPGKQLYFRLQRQGEYDPDLKKKIWVWKPIHITGIDAFRLIAQRTEKYAGQKPVVWVYEQNRTAEEKCDRAVPLFFESQVPLPGVIPYAARATVLRHGFLEPLVAIARWSGYVQTYKDDTGKYIPNAMWQKLGPEQLAKCAEALALRKAFPEDLWGLYIPEEFPDNEDSEPQTQTGGAAALPPAAVPPPVSTAPATTISEKSAATDTPTPATPSPAPAETPVNRKPEPPAVPASAPSPVAKPQVTEEDIAKRFGGKPAEKISENERRGQKWIARPVAMARNGICATSWTKRA